MAGIQITPDLFDKLRLIEMGALGVQPDLPGLEQLADVSVEFYNDE